MQLKAVIKRFITQNPHLCEGAVRHYSVLKNARQSIRGFFRYLRTEFQYIYIYKGAKNEGNFNVRWKYNYPCLTDWYQQAGTLGLYFWQDLWGARLVCQNNPETHYDIGSRIDGFIGHLASFRDNIVLVDVRPLEQDIPNVHFQQADATDLKNIKDDSVESLSALCSLEHFGLGRYGDKIDPNASFEAMHAITRVLAKGGHAYISVPIGFEHLEFNAHRIFYAETVVNTFAPLKLVEYSCTDGSGIEKNVPLHKYDDEKYNRAGRFGLFHFIKEV